MKGCRAVTSVFGTIGTVNRRYSHDPSLPPLRRSAPSVLTALFFAWTLTATSMPARAADDSPPDSSAATHEQVKLIRCNQGASGWTLSCFATTKDGKIVAVIAAPQGKTSLFGNQKKKSNDADKPAAEARLMDADGELLSKWPLNFLAQAVNVGPDGLVYLAGDGWNTAL